MVDWAADTMATLSSRESGTFHGISGKEKRTGASDARKLSYSIQIAAPPIT
jgi:hypothetical protein